MTLLQSGARHVAGAAGSGSEAGEARHRHGAMGVLRAGVAVAAALVCALATNEVRAAGESAGNTIHAGSSCAASSRVAHAVSTCVDAEIYNEPDDPGASSTFSVEWQNSCHAHGDIVVNVDMTTGEDKHVHLNTSGGAVNGRSTSSDVDGISCCWDESDLCYIREVVAEDGHIIRHTSQTSYTLVDVSTHQSRYDLCQEDSDLIYCQADPEGDAFTEPPGAVPDRLRFSLEDCYRKFAESPAVDRCSSFYAENAHGISDPWGEDRGMIRLHDSMCHAISAECLVQEEGEIGNIHHATFHFDEPLRVGRVAELSLCDWGVTVHIWNHTVQAFHRGTILERKVALRTGDCPASTVRYQDSSGNLLDSQGNPL